MDDAVHRDNSDLLRQLQIDREAAPPQKRSTLKWAAAVLIPLLLAGGGWVVFGRNTAIPVKTAVVQAVPVNPSAAPLRSSLLDASGYVIARRRATVSSKITGRVLEVLIEEGRRVEGGEIIARLDDSNWRAAVGQSRAQLEQSEANSLAAQTAFDDATPIYQRNLKQREAGVISDQAFDQSRATFNAAKSSALIAERTVSSARASLLVAQRNLEDTIVRAPFAGIVTEKAAQPGEIVSPMSAGGGFTRTGIGTIVDMSSLEVEVDVNESFINRVKPKQPVNIQLNAYPDWEIPGEVIATIPTADRSKATVKVRIAIDSEDPRILPEMGARVSFLGDTTASPESSVSKGEVLVPPNAVQTNGDATVVYVMRDGAVERRSVQLGAKTPAGQRIAAGLEAGSSVVIGDLSTLSDGAKVRVIEE